MPSLFKSLAVLALLAGVPLSIALVGGRRLAAGRELATVAHPVLAPACSLVSTPSVPLHFRDGSRFYLHQASFANGDGEGAIVGQPTFHWVPLSTRDSRQWEQGLPRDSLLGVILDSTGIARPIPNPFRLRTSRGVRIARDTARGWRVLFVEPLHKGVDAVPEMLMDSVRFMTGRFDGMRWTRLDTIGVYTWLRADEVFGSRLVSHNGDAAFAVPFDPPMGNTTSLRHHQGALFFQEKSGHWTVDSLFTWATPLAVEIAEQQVRGQWPVVISMSYLEDDRRMRTPSPFLAMHDSAWHLLGKLANVDTSNALQPRLMPLGDSMVVTWRSLWSPTHGLEWTSVALTTDTVAAPLQQGIAIDRVFRYVVGRTDSTSVLWIGYDDDDPRLPLRVAWWHAGALRRLGALQISDEGLASTLLTLGPRRLLLLTSTLRKTTTTTEENPGALTIATGLRVVCAR